MTTNIATAKQEAWSPSQKQAFTIAALAIVVYVFSFATAPYILTAIGKDLGFSNDNANLLRIAPPAASLLTVFIAGILGDIIGRKKVLLLGGGIYCAGIGVVYLSQSFELLLAGRALEGIGVMLLRVISLALIAGSFTTATQRAVALAGFAAISPLVQVVGPLIVAPMAQSLGWHAVVVLWLFIGVVFLGATLKILPWDDSKEKQSFELITPSLAGITLVLLSLSISAFQKSIEHGMVLLAATVGAGLLLLAFVRRLNAPSFNFKLPAQPGAIFVLLAVAAGNAADPLFFAALFFQKHHNLLIAATGFAMIPLNLSSAIGNFIAGPIIARIGPYRAVLTGFLISAAIALTLLFITPATSIGALIGLLSVFLLIKTIGAPALLTTIMGLLPPQLAGVTASWRNACQILGVTIGGVLLGSLVFNTFEASLTAGFDQTSLTTEQSQELADLIRNGKRDLLLQEIPEVQAPLLQKIAHPDGPIVDAAQVMAFRTLGPVMAFTNILTCLALWLSKRAQRSANGTAMNS